MGALPIVPCARCGANILWIVTDRDRKMPVDAKPNSEGNVYVRMQGGRPHGTVASKAEPRPAGVAFMPHFATCRELNRNRKAAAPPKPAPPEPPPRLL